MKRLVFYRDSDKHFEVRIYGMEDDRSWIKYGELILNDNGNWGLWTGTDYSSEGSGLENSSDECTEYTSDLDETYDDMSFELADILEIF